MELAAGVAGVIKVLLQLKNKVLVKSLHSENINPYIKLKDSPFYIVRDRQDWKALKDSHGNEIPRRAGISSFGAGGSNVHMIIEEYPEKYYQTTESFEGIFILSAHNQEYLNRYAEVYITYLQAIQNSKKDSNQFFNELIYTLQIGRKAMQYRLAIVAANVKDIIQGLIAFKKNDLASRKNIFIGTVEDQKNFCENYSGDNKQTATAWTTGININWQSFYHNKNISKLSLPVYPFTGKNYWITKRKSSEAKVENLIYYQPYWQEASIDLPNKALPAKAILLIYGCYSRVRDNLENQLSDGFDLFFIEGKNFKNEINDLLKKMKDQKGRSVTFLYFNDQLSQQEEFQDIQNCFAILQQNQQSGLIQKIIFFYPEYDEKGLPNPFKSSISGFSKTIHLLNPEIIFKTIKLKPYPTNMITRIIQNEIDHTGNIHEIYYSNDQRYIKNYKKVSQFLENPLIEIKESGTYLITGGAGGLGLLFAEYLLNKHHIHLILLGRSKLDKFKKNQIDLLNSQQQVKYIQCDITDPQIVNKCIQKVCENQQTIDGVIHAAGILDNKLFFEKDYSAFLNNLLPKINGLKNIDEATKDCKLDFFLVFSSLSAVLGDFGQVDYALSNRMADEYLVYRKLLTERGERYGKSIGINWPMWRNGGMHLSADQEKMYLASSGLEYLENPEGFQIFENAFKYSGNHLLAIKGDKNRINRIFNLKDTEKQNQSKTKDLKTVKIEKDKITEYLKDIIKEILLYDDLEITEQDNFGDLGFNSITLKTFTDKIAEKLCIPISPAVFFSHQSIEALVKYFEDNQLIAKIATSDFSIIEKQEKNGKPIENQSSHQPVLDKQDVAIIGLSAIMPGSENADQFWQNLVDGQDLVREIPEHRWDWKRYYNLLEEDEKTEALRWLGYIDNEDQFDPAFFKISPGEANLMDPQHRLFLQCAWEAIEDAGYSVDDLSGKNIAVFAGIQHKDYASLINQQGIYKAHVNTGNDHSMLPNRISYLLNINGPSEAIDTACSSSLVAVHRAVQSLKTGESEMAICGGVSLILSPENIYGTVKLGILSPDGRCKTLSDQANGYVKGEGVGVIILKPLNKAIADKDQIYAVLKGSAVNHGGRAYSMTAPNSNAQAQLLYKAYSSAKINPQQVSYIEMHGTGTELGDPVEIDGLKKAFDLLAGQTGQNRNTSYCALGSVKTNIGHLEPAAGIAGIMKVIYSIKNKFIPGILHFNQQNKYFDLRGTPFFIAQQNRKWENLLDENQKGIPRIAGISSFGYGGTNAHVILEEYIADPQVKKQAQQDQYLFILSAKNKEQLESYLLKIQDFIHQSNQQDQENLTDETVKDALLLLLSEMTQIEPDAIDMNLNFKDYDLDPFDYQRLMDELQNKNDIQLKITDIETCSSIKELLATIPMSPVNKSNYGLPDFQDFIYTLQTGRQPMIHRMALVVKDYEELSSQIIAYFTKKANHFILSNHTKGGFPYSEERITKDHNFLFSQNQLNELACLWVKGADINWKEIYQDNFYNKVSLPTYPFSKKSYWLPQKTKTCDSKNNVAQGTAGFDIEMKTILDQQKYQILLNNSGHFITDHLVNGKKIFAGVNQLEMIRNVISQVFHQQIISFKDVIWHQTIELKSNVESFDFSLKDESTTDSRCIAFELSQKTDQDIQIINCSGIAELGKLPKKSQHMISIEPIMKRCNQVINSKECYHQFQQAGLDYGAAFQGIQTIFYNENEAIALLKTNDKNSLNELFLQPTLLDSALQSNIAFNHKLKIFHASTPYVPFSLQQLKIHHSLPDQCYVYVQKSKSYTNNEQYVFDYKLLSQSGDLLIEIHNFTIRKLKTKQSPVKLPSKIKDFMYKPQWRESQEKQNHQKNYQSVMIFYSIEYVNYIDEFINIIADKYSVPPVLIELSKQTLAINENNWLIASNEPGAIKTILAKYPDISQIYYFSLDEMDKLSIQYDEIFANKQKSGIMTFFHLLKALNDNLIISESIDITVITNNNYGLDLHSPVNPLQSALAGFCSSANKENSHLEIRYLDIDQQELLTKPAVVLKQISQEILYPEGMITILRKEKRYHQTIISIQVNHDLKSPFRNKGVYLILGGMGGIGFELAKYLSSNFAAKLVLIGRSGLNADKKEKLRILEELGGQSVYFSADATDFNSIKRGVDQAKLIFKEINGVFHSAIVLEDKTLLRMEEACLQKVMAPKVQGSILLYKAIEDEALDFFCFFSSAQSFICNPGQSNYAAACTFKDSFARYLSQTARFPVKIINWGYWGSVGIVANKDYQQKLKRRGIDSIEPEEGMQVICQALQLSDVQFVPIKAENNILKQMGLLNETDKEVVQKYSPSLIDQILDDIDLFTRT
ncbi:MAG: SDR family NAD(P)-dependent oxidoreductase [Spirochaetes bacterium]|nr:SDR family NAD(P)-dependent oxidoreductase [Spirochaetota bacterium]